MNDADYWCLGCCQTLMITCPWCQSDACATCYRCKNSDCGAEAVNPLYQKHEISPYERFEVVQES